MSISGDCVGNSDCSDMILQNEIFLVICFPPPSCIAVITEPRISVTWSPICKLLYLTLQFGL